MPDDACGKKEKHGVFPFILAGISFIPLIGVLFGIVCILLALIARKANSKLLGILGGCGIAVTVLLYGVLLPVVISLFGEGFFTKGFEPHAISTMTNLVRTIEYYKLQNSRYPETLNELRSTLKEGELVMTYDVSGPAKLGEHHREFHYEIIGDGKKYLLFGVGSDGIPFTNDDIFPIIDPVKDKAIGWRKNK